MGAVVPLVCSSSLCRSHPHLDSLVFSPRSPGPQAEVAIQAVAERPLEWYLFVIPLDVCPAEAANNLGPHWPVRLLGSVLLEKPPVPEGPPGLTLLPWGTRPAS